MTATQVGIITVDGVPIGVIMQSDGDVVTTTPAMGDDGGNRQLDDSEDGNGAPSSGGGTPSSGGASGGGSTRRRQPQSRPATLRSSDGMDAYEGDLPERQRAAAKSAKASEGTYNKISTDGMDAYEGSLPEKPRPRDSDPRTPYLSEGNPFSRERFRRELEEKPWLKDKFAHIALGENQDRTANLAVQETAMNRAVVRGTSLEAQLRRHRTSGKDEGGYYAGWAQHYSPQARKMFDENLERALAGSNVSDYATDNASAGLAERNKQTGRFNHHVDYNRESFFSPGHAEPVLRDRFRYLRRQAADHEQRKANEAARPAATRQHAPDTDPM